MTTPDQRQKHARQQTRWSPEAGGKASKRMQRTLDGLAAGKTIEDATASAGVSRSAYYKWRERDSDFARRADRVISRGQSDERPVFAFGAEFRERYFGHLYDAKPVTPPHIQQMIDLINSLGPGQIGAILLPPEHAKSSVTEDLIAWAVAHDPNVRSLIISKTQGAAVKRLGRVQYRMTDTLYERFIEDFGPFKPLSRDGRPWRNTYFTVARQSSGERDYTVEAVGIGGQVYGTRTDLMILDDIADVDNQGAAEIDKQLEWLRTVALSRIGTQGRMLFIGTRVKEDDIYKALESEGFFDKILKLPAMLREPGAKGPDDPGEFLWPERFPPEHYLRTRDKVGPHIWALVHQQDEIPSEGAAFPLDVIESCYDNTRYIGHIPKGSTVVVGIDPAATGFTGGVAVAIDPVHKIRYIVDVWNEKNLMGDGGDRHAGLIQFIVELCSRYKARVCCIETNNMQTLLTTSLDLRRKLGELGVEQVHHQSGRGENDDLAIAQLSALFSNGLVSIPTQGQSKGRVAKFVHQFAVWRPAEKHLTRDLVKAFQFAEKAARRVINNDGNFDGYATDGGPELPPYLRKQQVAVSLDDPEEERVPW